MHQKYVNFMEVLNLERSRMILTEAVASSHL